MDNPTRFEQVRRFVDRTGLDAVLALDDSLTIGILFLTLETAGLSPQHVQVMGFDDIRGSRSLHPALTTVGSQVNWIGETAVPRLFGKMRGTVTFPAPYMATAFVIERDTTR